MKYYYEVYASRSLKGIQSKVTQFNHAEDAVHYAEKLVEANFRTIHTSVLKITRENYWDSQRGPVTISK